jgi:hypothetical protein
VVGDDWFEYVDEPQGGRIPDSENNNYGLVDVEDQVYQPMVTAMQVMHSIAPDRLSQSGPTCDSWATVSGTVTCTATMPAVSYPVIVINQPLPNGKQGTAYSATVYAGGGHPGYTFSLAGGALPKGVKLNKKTGVLSGTPTGVGTATFTVAAKDTAGSVGSQALSIAVAASAPVSVTTATLGAAKVGTAYTKSLAAKGGITPYTWSISAGTLPAGVTLGSGGTFSGAPTIAGTYSFTAKVTDSSSPVTTGTHAFSLVVKAAK